MGGFFSILLERGVTLADTARDLIDMAGRRSPGGDALHTAVMMNHKIGWIATFDTGFDGVPGIRRLKLA